MRVKVPKNFIPVASRMLCERVCDVQSALIYIPESVKESSLVFEVIEKGNTCLDDRIQPGSYVYVGRFAPCHIGFPGQENWYTVNEADVLGIVTEFEKEKAAPKAGRKAA